MNLIERDSCLPRNTVFLDKNGHKIDINTLKSLVPLKIRNRLQLNEMGLNGLATVIIPPENRRVLSGQGLRQIMTWCNLINRGVGLPKTDDVIIRTSSNSFTSFVARSRIPTFSEPALLGSNVSNLPRFKPLGENQKPVNSIEEFTDTLPENAFLIIHDDNYNLQNEALHGRVFTGENGIEVALATKTLHPRGLGEGSFEYPYVVVNTNNVEDLDNLDIPKIAASVSQEPSFQTRRTTFASRNCDENTALDLLKRFRNDSGLILYAHKKLTDRFGKACVTEFRDYNIAARGLGRKIHILDANSKF